MKLKTLYRYLIGSPYAGPPIEAYVLLTESCNLRCKMCGYWEGVYRKKGQGVLTTTELKDLICQLHDMRTPIFVMTGGEPTLREDLIEIIRFAVFKLSYCRLTTNCTMITRRYARDLVESGLDAMWVSIDGIGKTHDRIRGTEGTFDRLIEGLSYIYEERKRQRSPTPQVISNTIVMKDNLRDLERILDLGMKFRFDEMLFHRPTLITAEDNQIIKDTAKLTGQEKFITEQFASTGDLFARVDRTLIERLGEIRKRGRRRGINIYIDPLLMTTDTRPLRKGGRCLLIWSLLFVTPYGDISACQSLDEFIIGNLREKPVSQIWNSEKFRDIRSVARRRLPICSICCVSKQSLWEQVMYPSNYKRGFLSRGLRNLLYYFRDYVFRRRMI